jgi:hypothetical protein
MVPLRAVTMHSSILLCLVLWSAAAQASDRVQGGCSHWIPDLGCTTSGRYGGFASPMSMPYLFEDPFITTGVQAVGIAQSMPERSIFEGGHVRVAAIEGPWADARTYLMKQRLSVRVGVDF